MIWEVQNSSTASGLVNVYFVDAHTGWAVGLGGIILATRDGGTTWEPQKSRTLANLRGVHFADSRAGWAVGDEGTILATRDGGATWEPQRSRTLKFLLGVHFSDSRTGWAVGDEGTILATRDQRGDKNAEKQNAWCRGVHFPDSRAGWVVGDRGNDPLATRDGGKTWQSQKSETRRRLEGVHFADARTGWAVGNGATILATRDGGRTWQSQKRGTERGSRSCRILPTPKPAGRWRRRWRQRSGHTRRRDDLEAPRRAEPGKHFGGVYFADAPHRLGSRRGAERSWPRATAGRPGSPKRAERSTISGVCISPTAEPGWAVGDHGETILATRDGGTIWQPQNKRGRGQWSPRVCTFADARTGWAVRRENSGTIIATRDGGTTWQLQKSRARARVWRGVHFG